MTETPKTIEVIKPCPQCPVAPEHTTIDPRDIGVSCPGETGELFPGHEGAEVITLDELNQHEMWQLATEGRAGDGTELTPTFYVAKTGRALPVGARVGDKP